nr:NAD(P)-binding protein [uncultured Nocardioides sp.]
MRADAVVVGAGLSGVACARELRAAGLDTRVLDRGRVPGGRMAARTLWDRRVDLGASYLTVSDPGFAAVVDDWAERGLAREWTDTFTALGAGAPHSKTGPVRWGAPHGLRSLVEDLAADLAVERREVGALAELDADAVVLAMPDPQARRLVGDHPVCDELHREWEPVVAVAGRWSGRTWDGVSPTGRFDGAFVNDDPDVGWIADDGRRRGDDAPVLVAHSTPDLAARHLDDPAGAVPAVLQAVRRLLDIGEPQDVHVHRWTFARPAGRREEPYALVDGERLVGVCGDGWGETPKVETAWLSGVRLGRALAARLA